jgi:hypothetical protein
MPEPNRYVQIIERIFLSHYKKGDTQVPFEREDVVRAAHELGVRLPKNLGDVIYSFRYRTPLPKSVTRRAPKGCQWRIRPSGRALYKFVATKRVKILPSPMLAETKIPDGTPGVIAMYALGDEQALLAKVRYNRLIDIFTGVACYSLQSHLRTAVKGMGQVETDEVYVGVDRRGVHYVFPVQAKGGRDILSIVQIEQDLAMCAERLPSLICRPLGAQFMAPDLIGLFAFEAGASGVAILHEKHYRLVPPDQLSPAELEAYRTREEKGPCD